MSLADSSFLHDLLIAMPTGNSLYQRKPGRLAGEKKKFRTLVEKLEKLACEQGYTKKQIASELGVSLTAVYQWSTGYTLTARRATIERRGISLEEPANAELFRLREALKSFIERDGNKIDVAALGNYAKPLPYFVGCLRPETIER